MSERVNHVDLQSDAHSTDAFHLPGLDPADVERWEIREYGAAPARLRFPLLRPGAITRLTGRLAAERLSSLADRPAREIARSLGRAARRLRDPADPLRQTAELMLPPVTGYSPEMIRLVLDRSSRDWETPALFRLLDMELAGGRALDGFVDEAATGRRLRAVGPGLAFHVFAGNVPGVAVTSMVRSLLVKAATLGKTASGEPLLPVLFARALASVDEPLSRCLAVLNWPGGGSPLEAEALAAADVVVVYGGESAVLGIRSRAPAGVRLIEHGPRLSVGLVGREALGDATAALGAATRVAWAVSLFDQQGCVSPHVIWVEDGAVAARDFAALVGAALDRIASELPRGPISPAEAAAILEARTTTEFRAIAGEEADVLEGAAAGWTVLYDGHPEFRPSCLNRTIRILRVAGLEDVPALLDPVRGRLQTVAVQAARSRIDRLAPRLAEAGATRISDFSSMPWPPPTWRHDGSSPLGELVRWTDLEA